jgi:hypothetical protein
MPLIILVLLAVVAILVTDPFHWLKPPQTQTNVDAPQEIVLCDVQADQITALEIDQTEDSPFVLEREAGKWYVVRGDQRYDANMERVDKLLDALPGLMSSGLASDKPDKFATFEVDDDQAIHVQVYTGSAEPAVSMFVGKATPSYEGAFVRLAGSDRVYRAAKNIKSLVGFSFRDYRSKEPWKCEPTAVESVTVAPPPDAEGETMTFTRSEGFWKTPEGANANQNLLTELVDKISKLKVNDFVDEPDPEVTGLADREPNLVLNGPEGELSLTIGALDGSQYYVADHNGNVYKISEYNLKPYLELAFDELTFDDTAAAGDEGGEESAMSNAGENPDEGIAGDLPSEADE